MPPDVSPLRIFAPHSHESTAGELAARELLRHAGRDNGRGLEPLSRAWFEEIEQKRYARAGRWLPPVLEFSRHRDESLLMLGPGLGTDALHYLRHGARVTMAVTPRDAVDAIRRNFAHRGLEPKLVSVESTERLSFSNGQFDLAYLNFLHEPSAGLPATVAELYRVLKAGGKLFALVPARFDVDRWQRWLLPYRQLYRESFDPLTGPKVTARELRKSCAGFEGFSIQKRHLRRSELPHLWRALPVSLLERVAGRVLALRATKPVRAAMAAAITVAA